MSIFNDETIMSYRSQSGMNKLAHDSFITIKKQFMLMKKPILILLLMVSIVACHSSSDNQNKFGQIKTGMKSKDVIALVGDPDVKTPMFIAEWWSYPKYNKLIVMSHDTVLHVVMDLKATQDSIKTLGSGMQQKADSLSNTMKQPDSAK